MCVKPGLLQEVTSSYFKHIDKPVHSHIPSCYKKQLVPLCQQYISLLYDTRIVGESMTKGQMFELMKLICFGLFLGSRHL